MYLNTCFTFLSQMKMIFKSLWDLWGTSSFFETRISWKYDIITDILGDFEPFDCVKEHFRPKIYFFLHHDTSKVWQPNLIISESFFSNVISKCGFSFPFLGVGLCRNHRPANQKCRWKKVQSVVRRGRDHVHLTTDSRETQELICWVRCSWNYQCGFTRRACQCVTAISASYHL